MIAANELRIGGIFYAEDEFLCMTTVVKLLWVMPPKVLWESLTESNKGIKQEDAIIDLEPIPITPEILLACWFEQGLSRDNEEHKWSIGCFEIQLSGKQFFYSEYLPNSPELKSLHQLQNLYFALTGTELNYKP